MHLQPRVQIECINPRFFFFLLSFTMPVVSVSWLSWALLVPSLGFGTCLPLTPRSSAKATVAAQADIVAEINASAAAKAAKQAHDVFIVDSSKQGLVPTLSPASFRNLHMQTIKGSAGGRDQYSAPVAFKASCRI